MKTLSERIKAQRTSLKLTQSDVAKKIGIARVSYTQWEFKSPPVRAFLRPH